MRGSQPVKQFRKGLVVQAHTRVYHPTLGWRREKKKKEQPVKQFRGGLVVKAHRRVYDSTLGWKGIKKKRRASTSSRCELADHSQVDNLALWYKFVNFGAKKQPVKEENISAMAPICSRGVSGSGFCGFVFRVSDFVGFGIRVSRVSGFGLRASRVSGFGIRVSGFEGFGVRVSRILGSGFRGFRVSDFGSRIADCGVRGIRGVRVSGYGNGSDLLSRVFGFRVQGSGVEV